MSLTNNERSEPRYALTLMCTLHHAGQVYTGETRNLSRGGFSLILGSPVPASSVVQVSLALNFGDNCFSEALQIPAMVVWCTRLGEGHQIGAKFVQMTTEHREFLQMFINYLEAGTLADEPSSTRSPGKAR